MTKYICECCGKEMEDWPALAYKSPSSYMQLTKEELENAELSSDLCVIEHPEQTDRFIRTVLVQEVIESCQTLEYGVWVTLSEKSFNEYVENYDNKEFEAEYFGWLSNYLPDYDFSESIPTNVVVNNKIGRPFVYPHESFEHPFVEDFYNGLPIEEAERRINNLLNR
ncbi:hypothetical protein CEY12_08110 [Chryseobacterium sp. T16E-39]|uniref:DUF2199 domain-containing protein n=1 Tax=Chryseobacterium sp. T16E-39 TaxID=2015076 RepID=UPI000B5B4028|nr:DUF2199 domain-containing protein [Chryseobacterium sp. T16E-39]ASK30078.1 hypothetical protein CEY12_08110 [Chryseobacterium sp. T16E-39]